jgi:hypothetical protein
LWTKKGRRTEAVPENLRKPEGFSKRQGRKIPLLLRKRQGTFNAESKKIPPKSAGFLF